MTLVSKYFFHLDLVSSNNWKNKPFILFSGTKQKQKNDILLKMKIVDNQDDVLLKQEILDWGTVIIRLRILPCWFFRLHHEKVRPPLKRLMSFHVIFPKYGFNVAHTKAQADTNWSYFTYLYLLNRYRVHQ